MAGKKNNLFLQFGEVGKFSIEFLQSGVAFKFLAVSCD